MPDIVYQIKEPYPLPNDLQPNRRWAMVLSGNYCGGGISELTAITQYIYQHIALHDDYPEISQALRKIAVVEMRHLDLLGRCIHQLGMEPRYQTWRGGRAQNWNAGFVHYGRTPREMLELDLAGERQAIHGYHESIRLIPDKRIHALLERLIQEEELHIQILSSMLATL